MTEQLTRPGTDPQVHDKGWRSPVGFIQNAFYESRPGIHVEAVEVTPWIEGADYKLQVGDRTVVDPGAGAWGEEAAPRIRLVLGPRDGKGWALAHTDMNMDEALDLREQLNEQINRIKEANA